MNKQIPPAAPAARRIPSAEGTEARPAPFAVSPATGPLPAIYVPPSLGWPTVPGRLWHATARKVRRAIRHVPLNGMTGFAQQSRRGA